MIRFFAKEINKSVTKALGLFFIIIIGGCWGYMYIEDYTFVDAIYMTFITITTVGFSEVHSLSDEGKIFTIILIIFSLGIIGYLITSFGKYVVDGLIAQRFRDYKTHKKIRRMKNHVIVCGFGRNGRQAISELLDHKESVVVIDNNADRIGVVKATYPKLLYVLGDATHDEDLRRAGISSAKALITAMPKDADNLYVVLTAREINPNVRIISRSSDAKADMRLKRAGANNVVMPDRIGGSRMAKLVSRPDVVEFLDRILLQSSDEINIATILCDQMSEALENKSLKELNIRNKSGANIIGAKYVDGQFIFNPSSEFLLKRSLTLFVLGSPEQVSIMCKIIRE